MDVQGHTKKHCEPTIRWIGMAIFRFAFWMCHRKDKSLFKHWLDSLERNQWSSQMAMLSHYFSSTVGKTLLTTKNINTKFKRDFNGLKASEYRHIRNWPCPLSSRRLIQYKVNNQSNSAFIPQRHSLWIPTKWVWLCPHLHEITSTQLTSFQNHQLRLHAQS